MGKNEPLNTLIECELTMYCMFFVNVPPLWKCAACQCAPLSPSAF